MDGLVAPPTDAKDLEAIFTREWGKVMGTTVGDGFHRLSFLRSLSNKLSRYFDVIGWPDSEEDVLVYVRQAIERYA